MGSALKTFLIFLLNLHGRKVEPMEVKVEQGLDSPFVRGSFVESFRFSCIFFLICCILLCKTFEALNLSLLDRQLLIFIDLRTPPQPTSRMIGISLTIGVELTCVSINRLPNFQHLLFIIYFFTFITITMDLTAIM